MCGAVRENLRAAKKEFNKTEDDLKSLQSVGQIIGEVLRPLDNERCNKSYALINHYFKYTPNFA